MSELEEEVLLDLEFEVDEHNSTSSNSDTSSDSDSDDYDDGDIGEMEEREQFGEDGVDAGAGQVIAYQHEPEPRARRAGDQFGLPADDGDAGFRGAGNLDFTRLDPANTNNWCQCGQCRVHPSFTVGECVCCREIPEVALEVERNAVQCITQADDFNAAILNPTTLLIAWHHFTAQWRKQAKSFGARNNEKYRYVAYRQFVRWCWGYLGKDIRVQLPACVLYSVKDRYPDGRNHYTGTQLRPLHI